MFARLALLSLAVATASAAPTVPDTTQAPVDSCAGLGSGAFDTADNFTLAAFYTSLPNANATGLPLVLGSVAATDGAEYKALSTFGSFPYNQWTSLSLINGVLTGSGEDVPDAQAMSVPTGKALSFVTPPQGAAPQIFCAVADTDPAHGGFPQLAVNGDTDSFSLCPETTAPNALVNIVYNPDEGAQDYVFEQCTPVALHLVGLY